MKQKLSDFFKAQWVFIKTYPGKSILLFSAGALAGPKIWWAADKILNLVM